MVINIIIFVVVPVLLKNNEIRNKKENTLFKKYGATNLLKLDSYRKNLLKNLTNDPSINNVSQIQTVKNKKENTLFKKYGVINAFHTPKAKINLKKYYDNILTSECYLYLLYWKTKNIVKIGITNNIIRRCSEIKNSTNIDKLELVYNIKSTKNNIFRIEHSLHNKYHKFNNILKEGQGRTEWFSDLCINNILRDIKRYEKCLNT